MNTTKQTKINQLLQRHPRGAVILSSWLSSHGYSSELQKQYRRSGWFESIGKGAMIRSGDHVGYEGGIFALQSQLGMSVHPGGKTALAMQGFAHFLSLGHQQIDLFGINGEVLPHWFEHRDWGIKFRYVRTDILPIDVDFVEYDFGSFAIKISGKVRAMMECLHLSPEKQDLMECFYLMESLTSLRPEKVQQLLEQCRSIKVKRLFLFMAEKAGHDWSKQLDVSEIDLGSGKRSIVPNGVFVPKYGITVPKELDMHAQP